MSRLVVALVLAAAVGLGGPRATAHASDLNDTPECQQMFQQLARTPMQQMLWLSSTFSQYPLTPQGRPIVTGWPYSAYGPGNGYGPGSPYGPALGPWGIGAVGPGTAPPLFYGAGSLGPGGPTWQFARNQNLNSLNNLATAPAGLGFLAVANGIAAQPPGLAPVGGIGGPGTGDLLGLAGLAQGEIGNVFTAQGYRQSAIGNIMSGADLMQSVVGNRLGAADLNATMTGFPLDMADHLSAVIGGIQTYVNSVCPRSVPEDPAPAGSRP
ncbi:MAG TPA: hypothetical protein VII06_18340 [Chloroflexota bacterium]|jgi:hypothetical protein